MPYDPRHVSEGGNRGTRQADLIAPKGKFRLVWVDTFDGSDGVAADYDTLGAAKWAATKEGGPMNMQYVYDDTGKMVFRAGTFS